MAGRVEVRVNNTWGDMCGRSYRTGEGNYYFKEYEARMLCMMMFGFVHFYSNNEPYTENGVTIVRHLNAIVFDL